MALADPHQANDFPGDRFAHSIPHQPHNHAQQNAWVSFRHWVLLPFTNVRSSICIPPQVPPALANGQPEGHREDIPRPGRVQDPHHFDVAYQGIVDYHPQPLVGVSNPHLSSTESPFDQ